MPQGLEPVGTAGALPIRSKGLRARVPMVPPFHLTHTEINMTEVGGIAAEQLTSYIERVERLSEERKALADDISDVFKEARGNGFDVKTMKAVIKARAKDPDTLSEEEHMFALYMRAVEVGTPIANARTQEAAE